MRVKYSGYGSRKKLEQDAMKYVSQNGRKKGGKKGINYIDSTTT